MDVYYFERDNHIHETDPAWFHVDCANTGPRIQYVTPGK